MKFSHLIIAASVAALGSTAASATNPDNATYVNAENGTNTGTASGSASATFSVRGRVDEACILGAGGDLDNINFGRFGIYADASSTVENAFTSVGPRNAHTRTNLAGCNTASSITITKNGGANGMTNDDAVTGGYDSGQFQANLPYSVMARYAAVDQGFVGLATLSNQLTVDTAGTTATKNHGAWKAAPAFRIDVPVPAKALVAGTYRDTVRVELAAL
ncbi:hypothetical protein [Sphingopyxis fribergensis]